MRKVIFASIEYVCDFDTKEEAEAFMVKNARKGWWWDTKEPYLNKAAGNKWTVVYRTPHRNYNPGW